MSTGRRARVRSRLRGAAAWAALIGLFFGCDHIGDQLCSEGFDPNDTSDDCPYGPPGGPKVRESGCPDIVVDASKPECQSISWNDDIWPLLTTGQSNQNLSCASGACHDPPGNITPGGGLKLPVGDPDKAFAVLAAYELSPGYPYVSDKNPAHTWILCNLHADKGGSQPMPPPPNPLISDADYQQVVQWARCGQPRTKVGGTGGTGTGGGGMGGGGSGGGGEGGAP